MTMHKIIAIIKKKYNNKYWKQIIFVRFIVETIL